MFQQLQVKGSFRGAYVVYFCIIKFFSVVKERTAGMKSESSESAESDSMLV